MNLNDYAFDNSVVCSSDGVKGLAITFTSEDTLSKNDIDNQLKIYDYRCLFYALSKKCDPQTLNLYEGVRDYISGTDGFALNIPLTFVFKSSLHHNLSKTKKDLAIFEKNVIKFINDAKLALNHTTNLLGLDLKYHPSAFVITNGYLDDRIMNPNGRDMTVRAINQMKKAYLAHNEKLNPTMTTTALAEKLKDHEKFDIRKAKDDIYRHQTNALKLIERAEQGTFPYDENGEWSLS